MFKALENNKAVSQVLGFVLSLGLTATVVIAAGFLTSYYVDENTTEAAEAQAENIASQVVNLLVNAYIVNEQYPNSDYSTTIEIPYRLVDHFDYTISVNNGGVTVSSNDGSVSVTKELFKLPQKSNMNFEGTVPGGAGILTVHCYETDYEYKFDFGSDTSTLVSGYSKVTGSAYDPNADSINDWDPDYSNWIYRTPIQIDVIDSTPEDFQVLIELDNSNFNHELAKPDGSDIRFVDSLNNGVDLDFWIEQWYPYDTYTSLVWVKLNDPINVFDGGSKTIYMYYGNPSATSVSNGENTFPLLFDDFSLATYEIDYSEWQKYIGSTSSDAYINNKMLVLENTVAIKTRDSLSGLEPYIVETKTKAVSTVDGGNYETGLFVRNTDTAENVNYMQSASILSSGSFSNNNYNLAVQEWASGWNTQTISTTEMQTDKWYRLRQDVIDATNGHVYRNIYNTGEDAGDAAYTTTKTGGYVGLGIANIESSSDLKAYFEWIYIRKYVDSAPTISVGGTYSQNFYWTDINYPDTDEIGVSNLDFGKDFVYSNSPARLVIKDLDAPSYSILLIIGDIDDGNPGIDTTVDNLKITIYNTDSNGNYREIISSDIDCTDEKPFRTIMIPNIYPQADNSIEIQFEDEDNIYWTVCGLTLEESERTIEIEGGIP